MTVWCVVDSVDYTVEIFMTKEEAERRYKEMSQNPLLYSPIYPQKVTINNL